MKLINKLFLLSFLLFMGYPLLSQKEANNWYFGDKAAFNFSSNAPKPLTNSKMMSFGSTSSISDPSTGRILFYCNGESIWNSDHEIMLNGTGLIGSKYSTNTSYSVPNPANSKEYYLFTILTDPYINGHSYRKASVYYSVVDMSEDSGRGSLDSKRKNILLQDSVTEKIAAIPHKNGIDYWLLLHQEGNNNFLIYIINSTGIHFINNTAIGSPHVYKLTELQGHMKASPDNSLLAVTLRATAPNQGFVPAPFEVFNFDNSTGLLSNVRSFGNYSLQYGVSFSPNSEILYLHGFATDGQEPSDLLYQFNLKNSNPVGTRKGLIRLNPTIKNYSGMANFSLQIGPDGKLYGAGNLNDGESKAINTLLVINKPNKIGLDAEVDIIYFDWEENRIGIDLPNYIQSTFKNITPIDNPNASCSEKENLIIKPNPATNYIEIEITERCFSPYQLTIYNILGKSIDQYFIKDENSVKIDVSKLASGIYLIDLELEKGQGFVKRFVKVASSRIN